MTIRDDVHKALDEHAARSHGDICDDTGLESVQVTNALNQLKNIGQAKRTAEGWICVASNASAAPVAPAKESNGAKAARQAPAPTLSASIDREREAIADAPAETKPPAAVPAAPAQPAAAKRRHKNKPAKKEKPVRQANGAKRITAMHGALSFSLTEGCEIAIERKDGNGERAFLSKSDALRLADFIQLVRPALVDA